MRAIEFIVGFRTDNCETIERDGETAMMLQPEKREDIVRCRDCEHFERMNSDEGWCTVPDGDGGYARWMVDDDGYCYLGIRRVD